MCAEMRELRYCIQCTDKSTGKVGDFLYKTSDPFSAVSPIFSDVGKLFRHMHTIGLTTGLNFTVKEA